ncbi:hypothetical protein M6B38_408115 [Iris pallida]|uniref:Uncharacterized protein n=1 Tax=Iris pallida TaxID=29817 RepID=A0AAX6ELR6_IRIPA|nr:hypothetical protein M6B38_182320 [Iris pallida]KAJ6818371.1 hypothetical protein M6B38_408115 [Iris pallida]
MTAAVAPLPTTSHLFIGGFLSAMVIHQWRHFPVRFLSTTKDDD